ncbi:glycoside hydrolase family protein [Maribellus maritimus]|uniref:hypothetical protein n=1 Tax=Maribellus maritimus TaxID=2870838 RepID=UPI001EEAA9CD|nr:hypothetical protein [Maribellus maritimus]MCG6190048.1 hypothetical protein [Maribellus maritimus]
MIGLDLNQLVLITIVFISFSCGEKRQKTVVDSPEKKSIDSVWFEYKGVTAIGLAVADSPEGPYKKYEKPILDRSHEVLIWNINGGVAALASINSSFNFREDGVNFSIVKKNLPPYLHAAPGLYRPSISFDADTSEVNRGICMGTKNRDVYPKRFSMHYEEK